MHKNRCYFWWIIVVIFYFYQVIARVIPNVIVDELLIKFNMTASQFSSLGTIYLYFMAMMQIPIGVLSDIYGMRAVLIPSILVCIIGSVMFIFADSVLLLQVSRLLIAVGSSCSFSYSVKTVIDYFDESKRALFIGITLSISYFACIFLLKPLVLVINMFSWQFTMAVSCILPVVSFVLVVFYFPKSSQNKDTMTLSKYLKIAKSAVYNKEILLYAILTIGVYLPVGVFGDLWSTGFLIVKYGMSLITATGMVVWLYCGAVFGCFLIPLFFVRKIKMALVVGTAILTLVFSQVVFGVDSRLVPISFLVIGFLTGLESLCFTGAVRYGNKQNSGIIVAVVTGFCFLGNGALQQVVGIVLNSQINKHAIGLMAYSANDFILALSFAIGTIAMCFFLSLKLKD